MKKYVIPWIKKTSLSIVAVDEGETTALRSVLEYFGYRVDVLWVGSRKEFLKVLNGDIKTHSYLVFAVHGIKEGIYMPDEDAVSAEEIAQIAKLNGKTVLNLGCDMGKKKYVDAFLRRGKAKAYIAPTDYPKGSASLIFSICLFYELKEGKSLRDAVGVARGLDKETKLFKLFQRR